MKINSINFISKNTYENSTKETMMNKNATYNKNVTFMKKQYISPLRKEATKLMAYGIGGTVFSGLAIFSAIMANAPSIIIGFNSAILGYSAIKIHDALEAFKQAKNSEDIFEDF